MITQNELYDLSFVITLIRSDIKNINNISILENILYILKDTTQLIENNQIRKALSQLSQLNENWEFVKHENYYIKTLIFKNERSQNELFNCVMDLITLLQSKKYEQAYELADIFHVLPEMIADNKGVIPESYWVSIKNYKEKWKC